MKIWEKLWEKLREEWLRKMLKKYFREDKEIGGDVGTLISVFPLSANSAFIRCFWGHLYFRFHTGGACIICHFNPKYLKIFPQIHSNIYFYKFYTKFTRALFIAIGPSIFSKILLIQRVSKKSETATKIIAKGNNCVKPMSASSSLINFT